ncbi:MAG: DUF2939 domain-containing protein [Candidatus Moranbacteria bacterium]|nr:DUF2939 domain-containing protein [Candidatus Moranbacteria bacterium]
MNKPTVLGIVAVVLVILGLSVAYYFVGTPTYSLYRLGKAIKNHDSETFNRYVDVDRVVDSLFVTASEDIDKEADSVSSDSDLGMFSELGKNIAMMFASSMKTAIKESINRSIEEISSGDDTKIANFDIREVRREGKAAKAVLANDQGETIEINMVQSNERYWRIVGVNFDDFKKINPDAVDAKKVAEEQEQRAAEQAKAEAEAERKKFDVLRAVISLDVTEKTFIPSDIYRGTYQDFIGMSLKITNHSDKAVRGFQGKLKFMDMFDNEISTNPIKYEQAIKADESVNYSVTKDYNQFIDEDNQLKNTELSSLKYEWMPDTIIYEDGTKERVNIGDDL